MNKITVSITQDFNYEETKIMLRCLLRDLDELMNIDEKIARKYEQIYLWQNRIEEFSEYQEEVNNFKKSYEQENTK
jgi:hypothetical protein